MWPHTISLNPSVLSHAQVNVPERKLILSERAAMLSELIKLLKPGDEVEGVVTRTTDYGAFVSLVGSDGRMHGAEVGGRQLSMNTH